MSPGCLNNEYPAEKRVALQLAYDGFAGRCCLGVILDY